MFYANDSSEEQDDQRRKYQIINGYRIAVPGGPDDVGSMSPPETNGAPSVGAPGPQPPTISDASRVAAAMADKGGVSPEHGPAVATPELAPSELRIRKPQPVAVPRAQVAPAAPTFTDASRAATTSLFPKNVLDGHPFPPAPAPLAEQQSPGMPTFGELTRQHYATGKKIDPRVDPNDPKSGIKPEYRMGTGMKVLGTLGNFLSGFGGSNRPPTYVGRNATNRAYDMAEEQRQSEHANLGDTIADQERQNEANRKLFEGANRAAYEAQVAEARKATSDAQQQSADARMTAADAQRQLAAARASKLDAPDKITQEANARAALANQYGLKGKDRSTYILLGKLPKEMDDPLSEVSNELARQRLDDAKQARVDRVTKEVTQELIQHDDKIQKRIDDANIEKPSGKNATDAAWQNYKQKMAQIERDDYQGKRRIADSLATRLKGFGVNVAAPQFEPWGESNLSDDERSRLLQGTAAAPVPAPARTAPTKATPNTPTRTATAKVIDRATAAQYLQRAGGDKAKARSMAKMDGWTF